MALDKCWKTTSYAIDAGYKPVQGKTLLMLPPPFCMNVLDPKTGRLDGESITNFYKKLRDDYGIRLIQMHGYSEYLQFAKNAGFRNSEISLGLTCCEYDANPTIIQELITASKENGDTTEIHDFYIDEPFKKDKHRNAISCCTPLKVAEMRDVIHRLTNNATKVIVGAYYIITFHARPWSIRNPLGTAENEDFYFSDYRDVADEFAYSRYISFALNGDQTPDWIRWRNEYGNKAAMPWIALACDVGYWLSVKTSRRLGVSCDPEEFEKLFNVANHLGFSRLGIYASEGFSNCEDFFDALERFCTLAVKMGWLEYKQPTQYTQHWWRCKYLDCNQCDPDNPDHWMQWQPGMQPFIKEIKFP